MSRFFVATGDTDSESAAESSDEEQRKPVAATRRPQFVFSDDEDDEKRVVRSQKDKRFDELRDLIRAVKNSQKIKDVAKVQSGFDTLQKAFAKAKNVIEKEGKTPPFYIRVLVDMEDFISQLWEDKDAKGKLSKINAKALASLKQKIRKYNKDFESEIEGYRQNPTPSEDEDVGVERESDEVEEVEEAKPAPPLPGPQEEVGESDSDLDWDMSDESTSSSSEDEEGWGLGRYTAEYFLKKKKGDRDEGKAKKVRESRPKKLDKADKEDGEWEVIGRKSNKVLNQQELRKLMFGKEVDKIDHDIVKKKRDEMIAARGKKTVDRLSSIDNLKMLLQFSNEAELGVGLEVLLLGDLISIFYDIPNAASCMKDDIWESCMEHVDRLVTLLESNSDMEFTTSMSDDAINYKDENKPYRIYGSFLVVVERLDEEFTKILQHTDSHSTEFVTKLQWESKVAGLIQRMQDYIEKKYGDKEPEMLCRIYIRRIEHLYYKIDRLTLQKKEQKELEESGEGEEKKDAGEEKKDAGEEKKDASEEKKEAAPEQPVEETSTDIMARLTKYIYNYQGRELDRVRTRAVLCHIYHHALHDRWVPARDLMMMTHLQENIVYADVPTQILYNRALVQLGMCAFRHGMIKDAHDALVDIQSSSRSKELLAQGLMARHDRTQEQEKLEKRRQVPFHMHINLELMECVYLTSAMLLEIPYMAAAETEGRRRLISKSFHHQLKYHNKQPLVGPPESMREHVVAAAHAMKTGDWKKCRDYILSVKAWDLFVNVDHLKELLTKKIREESLRTFIFTYSETYNSLSLVRLAEMFELPAQTVHSIVSKMIFREEFLASLDEPTQMVVMHHAKPNKLQCLALQLADKIGSLSDHNEDLMKLKHAGPWNVAQGMGMGGGQGGGKKDNFRQGFQGGWQGGKHNRNRQMHQMHPR